TPAWRKKVETRTQMKRSKGVGMDAPQRKSIRSAKRQHHVSGVAAGNLVKQFRTVHRLRPRLDGWKFDGIGLRFDAQFCSDFRDFRIESLEPEVEPPGFRAPSAVVLGGRELGQSLKGVLVGVGRGRRYKFG